MKSAAAGVISILMTLILFLGMAGIFQQDRARAEVSRAMTEACAAAQQEALSNPDAFAAEDTYSQLFQKRLKQCLPKDKGRFYELRVYTADPERRLLDAELTLHQGTIIGKERLIRVRRTVIAEPVKTQAPVETQKPAETKASEESEKLSDPKAAEQKETGK